MRSIYDTLPRYYLNRDTQEISLQPFEGAETEYGWGSITDQLAKLQPGAKLYYWSMQGYETFDDLSELPDECVGAHDAYIESCEGYFDRDEPKLDALAQQFLADPTKRHEIHVSDNDESASCHFTFMPVTVR